MAWRVPRFARSLRSAHRSEHCGFTLLELIVVITIIGILGTIVAIKVVPILWVAKDTKAKADMQRYRTAATAIYSFTGSWPPSLTDLIDPHSKDGVELPGVDEIRKDPWGHDYLYELTEKGPVLRSLGRDGMEGGEGEDADLTIPAQKE